jgi:xanthine dehydrogenase accessory factor
MPTWTTQEILGEIVRRCSAGERVGLCTVVATRGSCPQSAGAKMIVLSDGRTLGTLGGGCVEAEVRQRAMKMLIDDQSDLLSFDLNHDYGWDDGLICGGAMDIYVQSLESSRVGQFKQMIVSIAQRDGSSDAQELRFAYTRGGKDCEYIERIESAPTLLIVGAGHVAQALGQIAPGIGFDVDVIDDRPDYASKERFPLARKRIVGDIEGELAKFPIDANTYVVIVTRGHNHDGRALAAVIESPAQYVGMIGSKRKIKAIYDELNASGTSIEKLLRVHAPIGYDIGAVSVPEIAISIAAQLVAVRRAQPDKPAGPMKIDEEQIRAWLARDAAMATQPSSRTK